MAGQDRLGGVTDRFSGRTIVVIGDLICDEYLIGKPARISREAPVIILKFTERDARLGGAANAAHNVHTLGARVIPIGVVGRDRAGDELLSLFDAGKDRRVGLFQEATLRMESCDAEVLVGERVNERSRVLRMHDRHHQLHRAATIPRATSDPFGWSTQIGHFWRCGQGGRTPT